MTFQDGVLTLVREGHDMSFRQVAVLFACATEPQTIRGLSALLHVAKPAIVRSVDKLESEISPGLVQRRPDPTDRRSVLVTVTAAGTDFLKQLT